MYYCVDFEKLRWVNGQHIRAMDPKVLTPRVIAAMTTGDQPILDSVVYGTPDAHTKLVDGSKEKVFIALATKIAQRDMELIVETNKFVGYCLKHDLEGSLHSDGEIAEVLEEPAFETVIKAIVADFDAGVFPTGSAEEIPGQWKAYVKDLGKRLGLKGKTLFHPARLALTGRMSGPDIGDQLQLAKAAEGVVLPSYPLADIKSRIEVLRAFNLEHAKTTAAATKARLAEEARLKAEQAAIDAAAAAVAVVEDEPALVDQ